MGPEANNGEETDPNAVARRRYWVMLVLRVFAFLATASATLVMALSKETKTLVIANIGIVPVTTSISAKFQHTPAFVFFVIANAMASFHNLVMLVFELSGYNKKLDYKGIQLVMVAILDMATAVLISAAVNAAGFMGELGRNGNSYANWNKICDKVTKFCDQSGGAILASYIGLLLLLIISIMSILSTQKPKLVNYNVLP